MRFHVLGIGSIGTLVSHHLRQSIPPTSSISLIAKNARKFPSTRLYPYGRPNDPPITLTVHRQGNVSTSTGYQLEVWHDGKVERELHRKAIASGDPNIDTDPPNSDIQSLIVCLKTTATVEALSALKPRLSPSSVITLVQNGMGVFDELCTELWPKPETRPHFILGTTTHGARRKGGDGSITHATAPGTGDIKWGIVPDPRGEVDFEQWLWGQRVGDVPILSPPPSPLLPLPSPPSTPTDLRPLHQTLEALLSLSHLSPSLLPMPHLHHQLLLKLAINSVINPLTAVIGAGAIPNGALFGSGYSHRLIRTLLKETSDVISAYLHSLSAPHSPSPDVLRLFSWESLEKRTISIIRSTAANSSSMATDVSYGRMTEILYINGYIISLGKRLGIPTPSHRVVYDMVCFTAEINGLSQQTPKETVDIVSERRNRISRGLSHTRPMSPREQQLEERRLELEERKVWVMETELQESRIARKGRQAAKTLRAIRELAGDAAPTQSEWSKLGRKEKMEVWQQAVDGTLERSTPREAEEAAASPPSPPSQPSTPPPSPFSAPAQGKKGSWLDTLIGSAPRQERTWDVPVTPPRARGPLPKKKIGPSASKPATQASASSASSAPSSSQTSPASQATPSSQASSATPSLTSPAPQQSQSNPTLPPASIDSLISTAPRAERSWDVKGGTIQGYTGDRSFTAEVTRNNHLKRGGIGGSLDGLIAGAPRQERTWNTERGFGKKDPGKFNTSRMSGS